MFLLNKIWLREMASGYRLNSNLRTKIRATRADFGTRNVIS